MSNEIVFSWAENTTGHLVHVDSVPNGLKCGCVCPYCHEKLLARHGQVNEHGFAHHSDNRGANLKICYMVTLYKLAEQIIQTKKCIHAPSYYGIFKEKFLKFEDVKIDSSFEREDKQPDVIATTADGQQYLVEFVFRYKVQHKQPIDYKNLSCLQIDLSNQTLETLEDFLLHSNDGRQWLNNEIYFSKIEGLYANNGKPIRIVEDSKCKHCELYHNCCAVKSSTYSSPLIISNSGLSYRLCKTELFETTLEEYRQQQAEKERVRREEDLRQQEEERLRQQELIKRQEAKRKRQEEYEKRRQMIEEQETQGDYSGRTCFDCKSNLTWMNRNGMANCGSYTTMGVPKFTPPDCAKNCRGFRWLNEQK